MTKPAAKNPQRPFVIGCIVVGVLVFVVGPLVLIAISTGVLRDLGIMGPGKEALALEAQYGQLASAVEAQYDADVQACKDAGTAARAALPPGALIPADWDLRHELGKDWNPVEDGIIRSLAECLVWEEDVAETLAELRDRLKPLSDAGRLTGLERRFDPNVHSDEEVLESFKDFVIGLTTLDEMETAIDCGAWPLSDEPAPIVEDPLTLGRELLELRAGIHAERGATDQALGECQRLLRLHALMLRDPSADTEECAGALRSATRALQRVCRRVGDDDDLVVQGLKSALGNLPSREAYAQRMRLATVQYLREYAAPDAASGEGAVEERIRWCRNIAAADALAGKLEGSGVADTTRQTVTADSFIPAQGSGNAGGSFDDAYAMGFLESALDAWGLRKSFQTVSDGVLREPLFETVVALAQYRADTGAYPDSLDALVPDRLEAVPVDPISGLPFVYNRLGDGYRLVHPVPGTDDDGELADVVLWEMGR